MEFYRLVKVLNCCNYLFVSFVVLKNVAKEADSEIEDDVSKAEEDEECEYE